MSEHQLELTTLKRSWIEESKPVVIAFALKTVTFTADDLHKILPAPAQVNWFGVLLAKLKTEGYVMRLGYQTSKRREANGRVVSVWRGLGRLW